MKKYIAPEVEIKRFAVENIMLDSSADAMKVDALGADTYSPAEAVNYDSLFGLGSN